MMYHDDELDSAIAELPLEPLPDGLRASILAAVSMVPGPVLSRWETAGIAVILALVTWLSLLLMNGGPSVGRWLTLEAETLGRSLVNPATLMWMAIGISCTLCFMLFSIPRRSSAIR
jgi:hypothetical protein